MVVKELIEELSKWDQDLPVCIQGYSVERIILENNYIDLTSMINPKSKQLMDILNDISSCIEDISMSLSDLDTSVAQASDIAEEFGR